MKILTFVFAFLLSMCGGNNNSNKVDIKTKIQKQEEERKKLKEEEKGKLEEEKKKTEELAKQEEEKRKAEELAKQQRKEILENFTLKLKGFKQEGEAAFDEEDIKLSELEQKPGILIAGDLQASHIILESDKKFIIEALPIIAPDIFSTLKISEVTKDNSYRIILNKSYNNPVTKNLPKKFMITLEEEVNGQKVQLQFTVLKYSKKNLEVAGLEEKYIIKK